MLCYVMLLAGGVRLYTLLYGNSLYLLVGVAFAFDEEGGAAAASWPPAGRFRGTPACLWVVPRCVPAWVAAGSMASSSHRCTRCLSSASCLPSQRRRRMTSLASTQADDQPRVAGGRDQVSLSRHDVTRQGAFLNQDSWWA